MIKVRLPVGTDKGSHLQLSVERIWVHRVEITIYLIDT